MRFIIIDDPLPEEQPPPSAALASVAGLAGVPGFEPDLFERVAKDMGREIARDIDRAIFAPRSPDEVNRHERRKRAAEERRRRPKGVRRW